MSNKIDIKELQQLNRLDLFAKHVVEGFITGLHRSPYHGFSVEFAEHRLYNEGESTKHIDWKLFARTDKLFVKRYEEETNLRSQIVIDTSSSMFYPQDKNSISKLMFSVYAAASLIFLLKKQRDAIGLSLFNENVNFHSQSKLSNVHTQMVFAELENLLTLKPDKKETQITNALHEIAESIHKRSLVIIFSDMFTKEDPEELFSALQHLRFNNHEVILFHTLHEDTELKFNLQNRPTKLVDMETGEELKVNPVSVKDKYREIVEKNLTEIKLRCAQYNIDFVEADIEDDFNNVLLSYLIKRNKLF